MITVHLQEAVLKVLLISLSMAMIALGVLVILGLRRPKSNRDYTPTVNG